MKRAFAFFHAVLLALALSGDGAAETSGTDTGEVAPSRLPACPYLRPELGRLMDAVTFRLSFDDASMLPDMAGGAAHKPTVHGSYNKKHAKPEFAPGLVGQALVLGTGAGAYARAGNMLLENRGAAALWVKPLGWKRPNGSNVVFLMTSGGKFYLQRQGPLRGKDGKVRRHEHIQYLAKGSRSQKHFTVVSGGKWENGKWHFLVANWAWPNMTLSINGGPFGAKSMPGRPEKGLFGAMHIGACGGDGGLLDEVMFFRRPLTLEEVQLLYRSIGPGTDAQE